MLHLVAALRSRCHVLIRRPAWYSQRRCFSLICCGGPSRSILRAMSLRRSFYHDQLLGSVEALNKPGRASAQVTLGPVAGPAIVTATVAGLPPVTLHFTATANPSLHSISGVVNGASFQPGISAGSWVTVQGTNLSATTRPWGAQDFVNGALPVKLDNVSITINGKSAYVYFISPKQLNVLAPADAAVGPVAVQITNPSGPSAPFTAMKLDIAPALFPFTAISGGRSCRWLM